MEYGLLVAAGALFVIVGMLFLAGGVEGLLERAGSGQRPGAAQPPPFTPPSTACDSSYQGVCVPPPPPDLDCPDLARRKIPLPVTVVGSDPHELDPDGDGLGC